MYKFRFCVLGSGSRGNATYYEPHGDGMGFMIDHGFPDKRIEHGLSCIGKVIERDVQAVLITHEHGDHRPQSKPHLTIDGHFGEFDAENKQGQFFPFSPECLITRFPLVHDMPCFGFLIEAEKTRVAHITDTGEIPNGALKYLIGLHALVIEANWDSVIIDDMINDDRVPLSRVEHSMDDHFSNQQMAERVEEVAWEGLEYIVLIHLSESNNTPELARQAAEDALGEYSVKNGGQCRVVVSDQEKATQLIILKGDV